MAKRSYAQLQELHRYDIDADNQQWIAIPARPLILIVLALTGGFVLLMVLKLVGLISWPWWIITLPLWGLPASGFTLLLLLYISSIFFLSSHE